MNYGKFIYTEAQLGDHIVVLAARHKVNKGPLVSDDLRTWKLVRCSVASLKASDLTANVSMSAVFAKHARGVLDVRE